MSKYIKEPDFNDHVLWKQNSEEIIFVDWKAIYSILNY